MIKRLPSRNRRSKRVWVKHVLKICLLLGVCFWLLYQVKHSHDKKREFDEKDSKTSVKSRGDDEILKLGRKDLPKLQEVEKNEKHEEEGEDVIEDEENKPEEEEKEIRMRVEEDQDEAKHEEEEQEDKKNEHKDDREGTNMQDEEACKHEEETKSEETEEERRGDEDDETDEQDQGRTEAEVDHEDEFLDEEKEMGGGSDDKENEEELNGKEKEDEGDDKESEEKDSQVKTEHLSNGYDNDGDTDAHVAREEHYKADDASSAVSHDKQITITETDKGSMENFNKNRNILVDGNQSNNIMESNWIQNSLELKPGEGVIAESDNLLNVTITDEKDHRTRSDNPESSMHLNAITNFTEIGTESKDNSFGLSTQITVSSQQKETETTLVSIQPQNAAVDDATNLEASNLQTTLLEQANNFSTVSDDNQSNSESTISTETMNADAALGDSFNNSNPALSESFMNSNATVVEEVSSGSLPSKDTADAAKSETIKNGAESGGTNETSHSFSMDRTGNVLSDSGTNESTHGTGDAHSDNGTSKTNESTNGTVVVATEDPIESSDFSIINDEKKSQIDLEALPDIRTNVDPNEDAASE